MEKRYLITLTAVTFLTAGLPSVVSAGDWLEFAVYGQTEHQQAPDIYANTVVWQQLVEGDWDIYAADITDPLSPSVFVIAGFANDQQAPSIYENMVVWQDYIETDLHSVRRIKQGLFVLLHVFVIG